MIKVVFAISTILLLTMTAGAALAMSNDDKIDKDYFEAIINLQAIEKHFTGTPIHLSKDEKLKDDLRSKLERIIGNIETYRSAGNLKEADNYRSLFFLGKAYSFSHDLDVSDAWHKSVKSFDMALEIYPESEEVLLIQGKNYMDASRFNDALLAYQKAIASNPKGRGRLYMAIAKISLGRTDETKNDLREHLKLYPKDSYAQKVLSAVEHGRAYGPSE